ncbi:hypothetical protein BKA70DRAFT_1371690 [Coprinopsis sp. MPI-PUGE-AT-0042]|nr:hypothetical protein BKA70DRAFT_1371690 [Coprinopsis sp. MPI-PUGE-AT-0042]
MGIQAVVGSYSDHDLLTQLSANADIVIACADADDLEATKAILRGLKERHDKTGHIPSLIHTVSVLIDDAEGMYASDTIYSDLDLPTLEAIPRDQPHREANVKTYIVLPSTIYGRATGSLVDAGLHNPRSQQIPKGRAGVLGKGANIWSNVHIAELASLYMLLVDHMIPHDGLDSHTDSDSGRPARSRPPSRPRTPVAGDPSYFRHGTSGYYFAESDEHDWLSVAEAIGRAMVDLGRATEPTPDTFFNNQTKYLDSKLSMLSGSPKKTTKDLLASIKQK